MKRVRKKRRKDYKKINNDEDENSLIYKDDFWAKRKIKKQNSLIDSDISLVNPEMVKINKKFYNSFFINY
jgi:hypothetical protein